MQDGHDNQYISYVWDMHYNYALESLEHQITLYIPENTIKHEPARNLD